MRLIVIAGADGTGKTTLIEHLAQALRANGRRVACMSLWDLYQAPELPRIFTGRAEAQTYLQRVSSRSRLHFFLHCLYGAFDRLATQGPVDDVLIDAYWYKYVAGELAHGASLAQVLPLVADFPVPDVILQLDAAPELTAARKRTFGLYESGLQLATREAFIAFQTGLRSRLNTIVEQQPCARVTLDATRSASHTLERALEALQANPPIEEKNAGAAA